MYGSKVLWGETVKGRNSLDFNVAPAEAAELDCRLAVEAIQPVSWSGPSFKENLLAGVPERERE